MGLCKMFNANMIDRISIDIKVSLKVFKLVYSLRICFTSNSVVEFQAFETSN